MSFVLSDFEDCPVRESHPPDHTIANKAPTTTSPSFHLCVPINDLRTPPPEAYIRGVQSSGYVRQRRNPIHCSFEFNAILD